LVIVEDKKLFNKIVDRGDLDYEYDDDDWDDEYEIVDDDTDVEDYNDGDWDEGTY